MTKVNTNAVNDLLSLLVVKPPTPHTGVAFPLGHRSRFDIHVVRIVKSTSLYRSKMCFYWLIPLILIAYLIAYLMDKIPTWMEPYVLETLCVLVVIVALLTVITYLISYVLLLPKIETKLKSEYRTWLDAFEEKLNECMSLAIDSLPISFINYVKSGKARDDITRIGGPVEKNEVRNWLNDIKNIKSCG